MDIPQARDIGYVERGDFAIATVQVDSDLLPPQGAVLCHLGGDAVEIERSYAYGSTSTAGIDCYWDYKPIDESLPTRTLGSDVSYQRRGCGYQPDDFTWRVRSPPSPGEVNVRQRLKLPVCHKNVCEGENTYEIHRGSGGDCRSRCVRNGLVYFFGLFGWRCGGCD